jgi:hypothetical protein
MAKVMYLRQIQTSRERHETPSAKENTFTCVHFAPSQEGDESNDGPLDPGAKPSPEMIPKVTW